MINFDYTSVVFAVGLTVGVTLDLLLLRTLLAPPFRIWPTPEPGSWQSLTFWGLFRGGMVLTFVVAILDWNRAGLIDWSRFIIGAPLFLVGFGITVFGYFNLGLGNTYCGADGLVSHGLYRFSRNPQYASSIMGLAGLVICANAWLAIPLALLMSGAYVLMSLVEEAWLDQHYGASYQAYRERTARFFDVQGLILAVIDKKQFSRRTG
ncbi:MAG TPA: PEMT/PEM2 methyltransferase family protein [Methyloceanibacter sp.]|nr:PEMT/PEM2 methyltransferase family protein [Methyloceanibacter sp.]